MKARRMWVCLGGGLCLTAAMLMQRVWGQQGAPPRLPNLPAAPPVSNLPPVGTLPPAFDPPIPPPISVPSKQISSDVIPIAPPLAQSIQPPPDFSLPSATPPAQLSPPHAAQATAPPNLPNVPPSPETIRPGELPGMPKTSTSSYRTPEISAFETASSKQQPTVSVEWIGAPSARFNQPCNYQILVRNGGTTPVNQVAVKPNLPEGAVIKSSEPVLNDKDAGWAIGTLAPGQVRKIDVTIVSQKRGYQNYSATVVFAANTTHLTEVREPLLQIKMKAPDKVLVGDAAPIQFTITNPGDGMTENVKVRASLPDGLDHPRGQTFEIEAGNLAPNESRTLQLACVAKSAGSMKATLVASAEGNLSATEVAQFELILPRLDLVLNGPKLRFVERPARYTLKVSNPSTAAAQAVVVNELIPAGFKFTSASNQGKYDENSRIVSWQIGDLPAGQSKEITVDLIPTVPGDHRVAAAVQSSRGVRNESSVQTRVEGLSNLILEVSNADNPVEVGADATYEIRLANGGTKAETNVELVCTLPNGVEYRDSKNAAGIRVRQENRDVIFEPLARLAPRGEVIYRVTVRSSAPGDVRFRARVRADGMPDALIREEQTKFYDDNVSR